MRPYSVLMVLNRVVAAGSDDAFSCRRLYVCTHPISTVSKREKISDGGRHAQRRERQIEDRGGQRLRRNEVEATTVTENISPSRMVRTSPCLETVQIREQRASGDNVTTCETKRLGDRGVAREIPVISPHMSSFVQHEQAIESTYRRVTSAGSVSGAISSTGGSPPGTCTSSVLDCGSTAGERQWETQPLASMFHSAVKVARSSRVDALLLYVTHTPGLGHTALQFVVSTVR
jgi:hypothetical protein